ncbi:hypothetical protein BBP40_001260 [Aspergillus hancockii]|nr:hypothetical protein BBP40_001260 [Aspergillus hancockii]
MALPYLASIVVGLLAGYLVIKSFSPRRLPAPLPPGPRPRPLIGNLKDLPQVGERDWEHWLKHKALYGPISSLNVLGQTFIILNDSRLAVELFEQRSKWHSDRPQMFFAAEMAIRRAMNKEIGSKVAVSRFNELQAVEARRFLLRVLENPEDLTHHIRKEAGAVVLKLAYGYNIEPHKQDPLVDLADISMYYFSLVGRYGAWLVDVIPSCRHFPMLLSRSKESFAAFGGKPYNLVKQQMAQGNFHPSYLSNLLGSEDIEPGSEREYVIKWSAASMYAGGADTTVSTMSCFFLAMSLNPEVQKKAQEEIDRVIGTRMPTFADRENLRYIDAMVKELLRWHPVVPTNVTHVSTHNDTCQGYFIPKGSIIIANIWGFTHDPEVFHDPMSFKPERFLGENPEPDARRLAFGFGRRICPGRVLADSAIFINIAQCLTVFNISKKIRNGKVIEPRVEFQPALISHPLPYEVTIKPRSPAHEDLIRSVKTDYPWERSHAADLKNIQV